MNSRAAARVDKVEGLIGTGLSDYEIARRTGISRSTVQRWRTCGATTKTAKSETWRPRNRETYSYLLGVYLGDGYIAQASRSSVLEISLDPRFPEIIEACSEAIWETIGVRARRYRKVTPTSPRYFFTNLSADILGLFCATCDRLGIRWTRSSHKNISVADRHSVAYLDSFVGPKR